MVNGDGCGSACEEIFSEDSGELVSGASKGSDLVPSLYGIRPLLPALRFEDFGSANRWCRAHGFVVQSVPLCAES